MRSSCNLQSRDTSGNYTNRLRTERVREIASALRIVFGELSTFRRAQEDDGILDEAILSALGDRTGLSLKPRNLKLVEMHNNNHKTDLVKMTKSKRNSVAIFQRLSPHARSEILEIAAICAKKGVSIRTACEIFKSQNRSGES